jgi:hypothetical protein
MTFQRIGIALVVLLAAGLGVASVLGLNSVKLAKDSVIASYTLVADNVFCDYDPVKRKADIGSNFLERE